MDQACRGVEKGEPFAQLKDTFLDLKDFVNEDRLIAERTRGSIPRLRRVPRWETDGVSWGWIGTRRIAKVPWQI